MIKFIARFFTFAFHPLLLTSYALLLVFLLPGYLSMLPYGYKRTVFLVFSLITALAPAVFVLLMYQMRVIESFYLKQRRERLFPLITAVIFYISAYVMAIRFPVDLPQLVLLILLTGTLCTVVSLLLNFLLKVSLHAVGLAAFISFFTGYVFLFQVNAVFFIGLLVLIAGFTAAARLYLSAHKPAEIYIGFAAGILTGIIPFLLELHS